MKLVKPKFEIIEQPSGIEGIYKMVEIAGRTCYKSENKITEDSAKEFVQRMLKAGHGAMLEHGTVYLAMPMETIIPVEANGWGKYTKNHYSKGFKVCEVDGQKRVAVTTNLRVLVENSWIDDLKYICEPTEYHEKRYCVRFILSRSIAQEYTRHRVFSFAMESQRYCNYSADKFSNEVTFIEPCWSLAPMVSEDFRGEHFLDALENAEKEYLYLVENGWKPQQAREVLPNACKTELVMTGFVSQWKNFFGLRCDKAAHPQARELAIPLREEFIKRGFIK